MGRKRHTPEQIITALREAEVGLARGKSVKLMSRELGITDMLRIEGWGVNHKRVVEQKQAGWRSRAHGREWILTFERYAFPRIGKMPVSEVTSADLLEILAPIWHTKADTARRLRQRIRAVLEWAVAMEFRIDNPCNRIDPVLGPQRDVVQHMRALPHREVAAAIQTARASTVPLAVRLAFEFLVLTAARWGEVRWAEWTEIDRDEGVWTVPARRTKANREHRVPLCGRALEILDGARTLVKGTSPYLLPNRLGKQLEEKQLRRMLGKHKIAAVPHGFRSSFRDWAAEETNHPREVTHQRVIYQQITTM